jgi:hypothetical protein
MEERLWVDFVLSVAQGGDVDKDWGMPSGEKEALESRVERRLDSLEQRVFGSVLPDLVDNHVLVDDVGAEEAVALARLVEDAMLEVQGLHACLLARGPCQEALQRALRAQDTPPARPPPSSTTSSSSSAEGDQAGTRAARDEQRGARQGPELGHCSREERGGSRCGQVGQVQHLETGLLDWLACSGVNIETDVGGGRVRVVEEDFGVVEEINAHRHILQCMALRQHLAQVLPYGEGLGFKVPPFSAGNLGLKVPPYG